MSVESLLDQILAAVAEPDAERLIRSAG
jgi:hypothetical protein